MFPQQQQQGTFFPPRGGRGRGGLIGGGGGRGFRGGNRGGRGGFNRGRGRGGGFYNQSHHNKATDLAMMDYSPEAVEQRFSKFYSPLFSKDPWARFIQ
ncbi:hypothetical protein K501DRAFT_283041 [Backusella circina FSU 941]|nr:hypothetical protein K501DRAFT_283041 [Backusella circina FSU 941]